MTGGQVNSRQNRLDRFYVKRILVRFTNYEPEINEIFKKTKPNYIRLHVNINKRIQNLELLFYKGFFCQGRLQFF